MGEKVNFNEGVTAKDTEDGDITKDIKVTGGVNFNKPGKYTLTYTISDSDGNEVIKTRAISVVNMDDYAYLTDLNWKSANSGWNSVNKDKAVSGNKLGLTNDDGQAVYYDKGIGIHATSTIIYDLTDKDYSYFTSFVGVNRAIYGSASSINFEVYVDGEKKFDSGVMNSGDAKNM